MANKDLILTQQQADGSFLEKVLTPTASQVLSFDGSKDPISALAVDTTKLPLAGGTMSGSIAMGNFDITGAAAICSTNFHGSAANLTAIPMASASGNLGVSNLNGGTGAGAGTFWRGDGTWAAPAGGGGGPIGWDAGTTCTLCTCLAGHNIVSANSNCAAILGGRNHVMCGDAPNALIAGGNCNCLAGGTNASSIVGGVTNNIQCASYGFLGGGCCNEVCCANNGSVIGGANNKVNYSCFGFVGVGVNSCVIYSNCGVVVGGYYDRVCCSPLSFVGGGKYNDIMHGCTNAIVGGEDGGICKYAKHSFVGGGKSNQLDYTYCSSIVGGCCNRMLCYSHASGILGGKKNKLCCSCNSFVVGSCISVNQKDCWAYMNNLCVDVGGGCLRACVYYAAGNAGQSGTCNGLVVCNGIVTGFV